MAIQEIEQRGGYVSTTPLKNWLLSRLLDREIYCAVEHIYLGERGGFKGIGAVLRRAYSVRSLSLSGAGLSDEDVKDIAGLRECRSVDLSENHITDKALECLSAMSELTTLDLDGTAITGDGLKALENLKKLSWLSVAGTKIGDRGVARLARMPQLRDLIIVDADVSDSAEGDLRKMTWLKSLDLMNNANLSDETSVRLYHALPKTRLIGMDDEG